MARIGPNIVLQTVEALRARVGDAPTAQLLAQSTTHRLEQLPREMVDEREANALLRAVSDRYGLPFMRGLTHESGIRTGDYLLAHRIPKPAQWLLPHLPPTVALRILLDAIGRHTWTFAGSARVHITPGDPAVIALEGCPLCGGRAASEPICDFYAGTFRRLAQVLLGPKGWAEEVSCEARGDTACRFLMGSGR